MPTEGEAPPVAADGDAEPGEPADAPAGADVAAAGPADAGAPAGSDEPDDA